MSQEDLLLKALLSLFHYQVVINYKKYKPSNTACLSDRYLFNANDLLSLRSSFINFITETFYYNLSLLKL